MCYRITGKDLSSNSTNHLAKKNRKKKEKKWLAKALSTICSAKAPKSHSKKVEEPTRCLPAPTHLTDLSHL